MKQNLFSILIGISSLMLNFPAFANGVPVEPTASVKSESISKEGILSCLKGRTSGQIQMIELKTSQDNERVKLVDYRDEIKEFCPPSNQTAGVKVLVSGVYTPRFLFWGGNLSVKSFQAGQN